MARLKQKNIRSSVALLTGNYKGCSKDYLLSQNPDYTGGYADKSVTCKPYKKKDHRTRRERKKYEKV